MPNQSDPNQNQQLPQTPFFPQSSSPPQEPDQNSFVTPPPDFSSVTSAPKKTFGTGKIIASILGLVVLIGGVGAGVLVTQLKQVPQKASTKCPGVYCDGNGCYVNGTNFNTSDCYVNHYICPNLGGGSACGGTPVEGGNRAQSATLSTACGVEQIDLYCPKCDYRWEQGTECNSNGGVGCQDSASRINPVCIAPTPTPTNPPPTATPTAPPPTTTPTSTPTTIATPTPTSTPTPTPTVPPIAPMCIEVKTYTPAWTFIENAQLPLLKAGDVVNFCVGGSAPSGTFDKAQFMINTVLKAETTDLRPGANDFCQTYTILSTDTTINVRAKIHHSTGVWVGETI